MYKLFTLLVVFGFSLALVVGEASRFRHASLRALARQEEAPATVDSPPSPAPYPPAGITPETPFELPTETEAPSAQPDQTYGPPAQPDQTYGPPDTYGPPPQPDSSYSPTNEPQPPAVEEVNEEEQGVAQLRRQNIRGSSASIRLAPLRLRPASIGPVFAVKVVRSEPSLIYTLK